MRAQWRSVSNIRTPTDVTDITAPNSTHHTAMLTALRPVALLLLALVLLVSSLVDAFLAPAARTVRCHD